MRMIACSSRGMPHFRDDSFFIHFYLFDFDEFTNICDGPFIGESNHKRGDPKRAPSRERSNNGHDGFNFVHLKDNQVAHANDQNLNGMKSITLEKYCRKNIYTTSEVD